MPIRYALAVGLVYLTLLQSGRGFTSEEVGDDVSLYGRQASEELPPLAPVDAWEPNLENNAATDTNDHAMTDTALALEHRLLSDVLETSSVEDIQTAFALLGQSVTPGEKRTLHWSPQDIFEGIPVPTPVLVANGRAVGPVLCMTGAIHGDEINSIETIRRVMHGLDPDDMSGTVVAVPIVNQMGFRRNSRYLPDRRDLNRYFPGSKTGSSAARIAYSLFTEIIQHCDALVDLHTGSFHRTNIPQLRADLSDDSVRVLVEQFGNIVVLHSEGSAGMLRREATLAGVPTVTLEAGESLRIQDDVISAGVKHVKALLTNLNIIERGFFFGDPQPTYMASRWLRAEIGGIFISRKTPGERVAEGEALGSITDPITNKEHVVIAEFPGEIIGMAMDQVVLPGYAIYHVGMDTSLVERAVINDGAAVSITEASQNLELISGGVEADTEIEKNTTPETVSVSDYSIDSASHVDLGE